MKVLFIIPHGKFGYKAPWMPLGAISIATFVKNAGYDVAFIDRGYKNINIRRIIHKEKPDVVCVSVFTVSCVDDALDVSRKIKKFDLPVIWGGFFSTENHDKILKTGFVDYVSMGEGEHSVLNLIRAIDTHSSVENIKGIAYLKGAQVIKNPPQELSDLKDLPVLDFSVCDVENYLHRYIFCKRRIYLYASKGCPGNCTFCSNPWYNCFIYRTRPIDYVIEEIKYLYDNYGLDGVYFSDECWYVKRSDMYDYCRRLEEENISIHWGCELRFGVFNEEDLQYMYDHGCRWILFGLESGDPEMLKKIRKNIQISQIEETVEACNRIGIVAISSFIIGYPDETPQQLQNTIDLVIKIQSGISVCNIFTPLPNTEITQELIDKKQYVLHNSMNKKERTVQAEYSPYVCNTISQKDLRVIRSWFMWREFSKKSLTDESKTFEVALNSIWETLCNIKRYGFKNFLPGVFMAAREAISIFWYAHFYPSIRKKYKLK